mmetsp:Transcript_2/g.7  ORF Transcript_2/g.7 Transcript_2/m.7 type:complete len:295 (+) Transcript_2:1487-2371(+)
MGTPQEFGIQLSEHAAEGILQLPSLPSMDLRSQGRDQLGVEVLRTPVCGLSTSHALEKGESAGRRVHETEGKLQGQARNLRELAQQHGAFQLCASSHHTSASSARRYRKLDARVWPIDLFPLLRRRVLHEVLPHASAELCEVDLTSKVPEHFVAEARPALTGRNQFFLLDADNRPADQKAFESGIVGTRKFSERPPLPLEALGNSFHTRLPLKLIGLAEYLAVLGGLCLGVALRPLDSHLSTGRFGDQHAEDGPVLLSAVVRDNIALLALHTNVNYVLLGVGCSSSILRCLNVL